MSWDLIAQDFPSVATVGDIPDDFQPRPIGSRESIIARISGAFPDADFSDPSWGLIEREGWSIEISLGDDAECDSFALHVRGGGNGAMDAVAGILAATGVRAIDVQTSQFFDHAAALESFATWQAYRDQIATPKPAKPGFFRRLFGN